MKIHLLWFRGMVIVCGKTYFGPWQKKSFKTPASWYLLTQVSMISSQTPELTTDKTTRAVILSNSWINYEMTKRHGRLYCTVILYVVHTSQELWRHTSVTNKHAFTFSKMSVHVQKLSQLRPTVFFITTSQPKKLVGLGKTTHGVGAGFLQVQVQKLSSWTNKALPFPV